MAYTYPVKWITSEMRGAPVLNGTPGTLIAVLDAFLLTGWGAATAISVEVLDGVGTAIFNAGITFTQCAVVAISGATPAALNGEARVLTSASDRITFETDAPNGTATGSIVFKFAPQGGWEKAFSGTNKAVYRSTDVQSAKHCLRVDDAGTTTARVVGYETMSDVDSGVAPFPTAAQFADGGYWWKSAYANSTANAYAFFADPRAILKAVLTWSSHKNVEWRGFGDAVPLATAGDAWATFLSSGGSSSGAAGGYQRCQLDNGAGPSTSYGMLHVARVFSGIGGSAPAVQIPGAGATSVRSGQDTTFGVGPSSVTGAMTLTSLYLADATAGANPRARVPGVRYVPHSGTDSLFSRFSVVDGAGTDAGRRFMSVPTGDGVSNAQGVVFVDITGPWRD